MSWDEIKKGVNSDLNVPLNHLIWLNDYKTYGENSYVFQNKDILGELYKSPVSANDVQIMNEALTYLVSINDYLGQFIKSVYFSDSDSIDLTKINTVEDLVNAYYPLLWLYQQNGSLYDKFGQNEDLLNAVLHIDVLGDVLNEHGPDPNASNLRQEITDVWVNKNANSLCANISNVISFQLLGPTWNKSILKNNDILNAAYDYLSSNYTVKSDTLDCNWYTGAQKQIVPSSSDKHIAVISYKYTNFTGVSNLDNCFSVIISNDSYTETFIVPTAETKTLHTAGTVTIQMDNRSSAGGNVTTNRRLGEIKYVEV